MPTVLVVDDEPLNRKLLRSWLSRNYRVIEAEDGEAALARFDEQVDVVLLDVMLPGRSGVDVMADLRRRAGPLFLPIVLLTALGDQEHRNAGLAAGADDYLAKPVDRRELLLRVASLVRLREQERRIQEQLEQLRQLDALKDDLVDLLVHDLRNPISGISALLEQLSPDAPPGPGLTVARAAATRAQDLLDDLLRIRELEDAAVTLEREEDTLREVILDARAGFDAAALASGVEVAVIVEDELTLWLDRGLVRRAIENLVDNAVRYAPRGSVVELTVRGEELIVSDRGPGISADERLFERYGQVGERVRSRRKGVGLGLYLVRLVASAHGGRAWAEPRTGGGASFHLWLPRG